MWEGVTLMTPTSFERAFLGAHFKTCALAWRKLDALGYEFISHTGSLSGARAWVGLVPELDLGIAILDNGNNSKVRTALMTALLHRFAETSSQDWVNRLEAWHEAKVQKRLANSVRDQPEGSGAVFLPLENYAGVYKDNWFGHVDITVAGDGLRFTSRKSRHLAGTLEPFSGHTFVVRWDNRKLEADAWVKFEDNFGGAIIGIRIQAVSETTDSSFDFQDLSLVRVE